MFQTVSVITLHKSCLIMMILRTSLLILSLMILRETLCSGKFCVKYSELDVIHDSSVSGMQNALLVEVYSCAERCILLYILFISGVNIMVPTDELKNKSALSLRLY